MTKALFATGVAGQNVACINELPFVKSIAVRHVKYRTLLKPYCFVVVNITFGN